MKQRGSSTLNTLNANMLITGGSGTGKSELLMKVRDFLLDEGLFKEEECEIYSSLSIENLDLSKTPLKAIFLDDAHRVLPREGEDINTTPLGYLFQNVRNFLRSKEEHLILVTTAEPAILDFLADNPEWKSLFSTHLSLSEYSPAELARICKSMLESTYSLSVSEDALDKLVRVFNHERRNSEKFGNAHLASVKANEIMMAATRRCGKKMVKTVLPEDIPGEEYVPKTLEEVMTEFDRYVGVDEIKNTLSAIVDSIQSFRKLHPGENYELKGNYLFLGNPGTGKTTMARLFADALSAMGILSSGQLVEKSPSDLRGEYVGHTGPKVEAAFDQAMGGVLFIDEAYDLWKGRDDQFGSEAVTVLLKNAEDRRGKLVVILAGYPREMEYFVKNSNPGMESRFGESVFFRDYSAEELTEIGRRMITAQGYALEEEASRMFGKFFEKLHASKGKDFANARAVRNAVDKMIKAQNTRVRKEMGNPGFDQAQEFLLTKADITGSEKKPKTVEEVIASLDDLIGMAEIKEEIRKLANVAMINRLRMERGIGTTSLQPINIILTGNPGTGKTTIAKRLGEVLHAAGVLPIDKVVEREAKTILSSYMNASGQNMDKAVDEAMGGVLFIDEAYNLLP
ncbi:MAG: AAA family ATPase, partial [Duncaniella sp.]|nr:AAA family ATPase [Duncaniella sp.]